MSSWAIVAVIAIVVWGIVQMAKARAGIISDEDGNETYIGPRDDATRAEVEETRREIEQLRERLHVLERIATDNNTMDARERARIAAEIEALRGESEPKLTDQTTQVDQSTPLDQTTLTEKEQSK